MSLASHNRVTPNWAGHTRGPCPARGRGSALRALASGRLPDGQIPCSVSLHRRGTLRAPRKSPARGKRCLRSPLGGRRALPAHPDPAGTRRVSLPLHGARRVPWRLIGHEREGLPPGSHRVRVRGLSEPIPLDTG